MSSIKEEVISLLEGLPDEVDFEGIIESIIVRQKILKGIKDSENGEYCTQDEAKSAMDRLQTALSLMKERIFSLETFTFSEDTWTAASNLASSMVNEASQYGISL